MRKKKEQNRTARKKSKRWKNTRVPETESTTLALHQSCVSKHKCYRSVSCLPKKRTQKYHRKVRPQSKKKKKQQGLERTAWAINKLRPNRSALLTVLCCYLSLMKSLLLWCPPNQNDAQYLRKQEELVYTQTQSHCFFSISEFRSSVVISALDEYHMILAGQPTPIFFYSIHCQGQPDRAKILGTKQLQI